MKIKASFCRKTENNIDFFSDFSIIVIVGGNKVERKLRRLSQMHLVYSCHCSSDYDIDRSRFSEAHKP